MIYVKPLYIYIYVWWVKLYKDDVCMMSLKLCGHLQNLNCKSKTYTHTEYLSVCQIYTKTSTTNIYTKNFLHKVYIHSNIIMHALNNSNLFIFCYSGYYSVSNIPPLLTHTHTLKLIYRKYNWLIIIIIIRNTHTHI